MINRETTSRGIGFGPQAAARPTTSQGRSPAQPQRLLRTTLGELLRRTRRAQGRTLADVAHGARVSMQYLSELERGRKEASSEVLAAICDALRIDLSDLLAAAGRELIADRARQQATIIRLGAITGRSARQRPAGRPSTGPQALLAA